MDKFVVFLLCLFMTIGGVVHLYDNIVDGFFALRFCSALAKHLLERIRSFRFVSGVLIGETSPSGFGVDAIDFDDKRYFLVHTLTIH